MLGNFEHKRSVFATVHIQGIVNIGQVAVFKDDVHNSAHYLRNFSIH
jgi:hypothetical protein